MYQKTICGSMTVSLILLMMMSLVFSSCPIHGQSFSFRKNEGNKIDMVKLVPCKDNFDEKFSRSELIDYRSGLKKEDVSHYNHITRDLDIDYSKRLNSGFWAMSEEAYTARKRYLDKQSFHQVKVALEDHRTFKQNASLQPPDQYVFRLHKGNEIHKTPAKRIVLKIRNQTAPNRIPLSSDGYPELKIGSDYILLFDEDGVFVDFKESFEKPIVTPTQYWNDMQWAKDDSRLPIIVSKEISQKDSIIYIAKYPL